ncbi:hypothetical protein [Lysobacter auxotrophicus]|uniref:Uncharacterized protein n=1 Tax=Lysobacter auxotrophicus TaxID=2992573 RepID=A0ABM8DG39_9GAMM|nr:hypothetical protein [Lysobacter auxotrophicus]BDU17549.1 hypothetical protein LA521A_27500 [Lysobacter auxotrophicus]
MSNGRQGEAVDGLATLTDNKRATRARPAPLPGISPINSSLPVHDAIVRRIRCDNHVQVIPR